MSQRKLRPRAIVPSELYVERAADRQLRAIIEDMGRPGYVLVARQMGKTNLLIHMKNERVHDIVLYHDLSIRFDSARQWFRNLIDNLMEGFGEKFPIASKTILQQRSDSNFEPNVEYDRHLRLILREVSCNVIIVLDEVDSLINTLYSDIILSQIRSMYFSRSNHREYERLTYILSGVIEPTDLIKDKNISPFNIGEKIYLENFSFPELLSFISRANLPFDEYISSRVFDWTSGNPRMSWEVCSELEAMVEASGFVTVDDVDLAVKKVYLAEFDRAPIDHIRTLARSDQKIQSAIVSIRYGKSEFLDQDIKSRLYLAGITNSAGGSVEIANKIVDIALSEKWLQSSGDSPIFSVANAFYAQGNYRAAVETFENLRLGTNDENFSPQDRKQLALSYLYTRKFGDATRELRQCLAEQNDQKLTQTLNLELALALHGEGDFDEAQKFLLLAADGPNEDIGSRAELESISIILMTGPEELYLAAVNLCERIIAKQDTKEMIAGSLAQTNRILALALSSELMFLLKREREGTNRFDQALSLSPANFQPTILLAKAVRSTKRNLRVDLARKIVQIILANRLPISIAAENRLQLGLDRFSDILLLLIKERLIPEFDSLIRHYIDINFASEITPFAALKHLYAEFSDIEKQREYIELLVWAVRYFGNLAADWLEEIEVYREIVMMYQGNERTDLRSIYLTQISSHIVELEKFFDARHVEALSVIGLAVLQKGEWRLGRRLYDVWEVVRHNAENGNVYAFLLDYLQLMGVKGGQIFGVNALDIAARILKSAKDNDATFRKSTEGDLVSMIKMEAEMTIKKIPPPPLTREDVFRSLGRNDWVTVQYVGLQPYEKKFKYVHEDLRKGRCKLISVRTNN
ncbi:MAG: AAA-like domain-containing protein [Massilia sp.]